MFTAGHIFELAKQHLSSTEMAKLFDMMDREVNQESEVGKKLDEIIRKQKAKKSKSRKLPPAEYEKHLRYE